MAAAATMAAAARELVLRAGVSDMEEEEGPLVRARGCRSSRSVVRSSLSSGRRRLELDTGFAAVLLRGDGDQAFVGTQVAETLPGTVSASCSHCI